MTMPRPTGGGIAADIFGQDAGGLRQGLVVGFGRGAAVDDVDQIVATGEHGFDEECVGAIGGCGIVGLLGLVTEGDCEAPGRISKFLHRRRA